MAYTYKKLTDVPTVETAEEPRILIEDGGNIKKMPASNIAVPQVKADWEEDDPSSAAFILNKPDLSKVGGGGGANVVTYAMSYTINSGVSVPSHLVHADGSFKRVTAKELVEAWDQGNILRISDATSERGSIVGVYYTMASGAVNFATVSYFLGSDASPKTLSL